MIVYQKRVPFLRSLTFMSTGNLFGNLELVPRSCTTSDPRESSPSIYPTAIHQHRPDTLPMPPLQAARSSGTSRTCRSARRGRP